MILGFSSSGPYCGVALWSDAKSDVIAALHEERARGQAERLMPMIEEVLEHAGVARTDLSAIGVGVGPGNFTGIRISVSAARGLALGLGIPAVGVSLLEALSWGIEGPVLTSIAAGRDHLYVQRFGAGVPRAAQQITLDDLADWAVPNLLCVGNRADEIAARLGARAGPAPFYPGSAVARIAATRWRDDPPRPAPLYMRAPDAAPGRDTPPQILP